MRLKIFNLLFLATLLVAWAIFLRPTFLGGPLGFAIVSGESMEPNYYDGDFVITRRGEYQNGDVIAFHAEEGAGMVIHRIIGGDGETGFVTQGDNRQTIDEWRPRNSDVAGKSWIRIPGAGKWLAEARQPFIFAAMIGLFGFLAVVTTRFKSRHRRGLAMQTEEFDGRKQRSISLLWAGAGFAGVVAIVSLLLAAYAFSRDATRTELVQEPRYAQTASFDYTVLTQPSNLYPEGRIGPIQDNDASSGLGPVYTRLVQGIDVGFDYQLAGTEVSDLAGTYSAQMVITAGDDEWSRPQQIKDATPFQGSSFQDSVHVDLTAIRALIESIENETGVAANFYTIGVVLDVAVSGAVHGEPLQDAQQPVLAFRLSRSRMELPDEVVFVEEEGRARTITVDQRAQAAGLSVPIDQARVLSLGGVAAGLLLSGALTVVFLTGIGQSDASILRMRYGAAVIPVREVKEEGCRTVHVVSLHDLGRIAGRTGGVVYSQEVAGRTRYFITDGTTTVVYGRQLPNPGRQLESEAAPFDGRSSDQPAVS